MPDREAPGSEPPVQDPGATRLEAVERLRRQLEQVEGGGRSSDSARRQRRPRRAKSDACHQDGTETQAENLGIRLVADRAYGRDELVEALAANGFAADIVQRALDQMTEAGLLGAVEAAGPPDRRAGEPVEDADGRGRRRGRRRRTEKSDSEPAGGGTEAQAKDVCLRLLTDRARSRSELADKLAAKGFTSDVAERALNRLAEVGLIDDAAFAEQWVHSRHTYSGKGKKAIAQELRRKGVAPADAESALASVTAEDEHTRAADLVRRKLKSLPPDLTRDKAIGRLVGMLARRGYNSGTAYAVVKTELSDIEFAEGQENSARRRGTASRPVTAASATTENLSTAEDYATPDGQATTDGHDDVVGHAPADDYDTATDLVRRKLRTMPPNLDRDKAIRRLVGMLARRGYSQSTAYTVVKAELAATESGS